jgi:hypothetical protein
MPPAFSIQGSGFRVQGSGFRVQGSGFRVQGSGFRVQGSGFRTIVFGIWPSSIPNPDPRGSSNLVDHPPVTLAAEDIALEALAAGKAPVGAAVIE